MSVRARPTNRLQDSPKGRQPGLIESDLARAFTHTLTSSRFEMVHRQRATSILAAGSEAPVDCPRLEPRGVSLPVTQCAQLNGLGHLTMIQ